MKIKKNKDSVSSLMKLRELDKRPRGIICDPGFKILGTPLGFSGAKNPGLLFCSSIDDLIPSANQRVIGTSLSINALHKKRPAIDALAVDFGHVIRLGRMDLRLFPSGLGPGAAMLEIKYNDRTILYSSGVRMATPLYSPSVEPPSCDLLLLDTKVADSRPPSPRSAHKQLVSYLRQFGQSGAVPAIVCGTFGAALDVIWSAAEEGLPVSLHRPIFEVARGVGHMGIPQKHITRLNQTWPKKGIVLFLQHLWPTSRFSKTPVMPVVYAGPGKAIPAFAERGLRIGEREDRAGLVSFALASGASQVVLGPTCTRATAVAIEKAGLKVHFMEQPVQLPLPM